MITNIKRVSLIVTLILLVEPEGWAQNNFEIQNACIKDGELSMTFINRSKTITVVPCLSYRSKPGAYEKYLDEQYIEIKGDTLTINTSVIHPAGLVDSKGIKAKNSEVRFNDKKLKPGKVYKTHIRLNIQYASVRFVRLTYDGISDSKQLCIE